MAALVPDTAKALSIGAGQPWHAVRLRRAKVSRPAVQGGYAVGSNSFAQRFADGVLPDAEAVDQGDKQHGDSRAHAWWSFRCSTNVRWLAGHGYGSPEEFPEDIPLRQTPRRLTG